MSEQRASAELIEDRGEAAESEEFFRSRPFLDAEGVTHTLRIEWATERDEPSATLVAPLIVRAIADGPERDAISPYGYPGLAPPARGEELRHRAGATSSMPLRSTSPPPAWSASSSATGSGRPP